MRLLLVASTCTTNILPDMGPILLAWILTLDLLVQLPIVSAILSIIRTHVIPNDVQTIATLSYSQLQNYAFIVPLWRIYASVNKASIGSCNDLLPARHWAIPWSSADIWILQSYSNQNMKSIRQKCSWKCRQNICHFTRIERNTNTYSHTVVIWMLTIEKLF